MIRISEGQQFGSGFVGVNPKSKIPALLDRSDPATEIAREAMDAVGVDAALVFARQEYVDSCVDRYPDRFGGVVVFDKTGTLTLPELDVTNAADVPREVFELAGRLALASHHPVAAAVARAGTAAAPRRRRRPRHRRSAGMAAPPRGHCAHRPGSRR